MNIAIHEQTGSPGTDAPQFEFTLLSDSPVLYTDHTTRWTTAQQPPSITTRSGSGGGAAAPAAAGSACSPPPKGKGKGKQTKGGDHT